jgi:hypothetical protein
VRISEQTATFAVYVIDRLLFTIMVERVYSVVRADTLYKPDYVSSFNPLPALTH